MTSRPYALLLCIVVVVGATLRLVGLGDWSIDGDELYSWYDVGRLLAGETWPEGPRTYPLGYLGMAGMVSLAGLSEGVLRLFPALCGAAAVAALAGMRRDVLDARVALVAAGIAALSPWLIYHAQTARFYGPLLLFATLTTLWSLPGKRRQPWAAAGGFVLALLCHPSALLLLPCMGWGLAGGTRKWRSVGWAALGAALLVGAAWFAIGDTVLRIVQRALSVQGGVSYEGLHFTLGLGYNLGPEVGLLVAAGLGVSVVRREPAGDALGWTSALGLAALLGLALAGISVHQRYAMALVPATLLVAGRGASGLAGRSPWWAAVVVSAIMVAPVPRLIDHYRHGNRSDFRGAAAWFVQHAGSGDIIVADEHAALELYLQNHAGFGAVVVHEAPLRAKMMRGFVRNKREVWVLLKASRMSGHYGSDFTAWVHDHFDEVARVGSPPLPLVRHDNVLLVYRRRERLPSTEADR